ncbi:hypothetical protein Tco_0551448 [Tanacetum coccineum]
MSTPAGHSHSSNAPQETSVEILQAKEDLMISIETFLKKFNRISFRETPKESSIPVRDIISELPLCVAITPEEPDDSLSMGDEHLSTIPETKSDELIKSSVENLVSIPSESEDFFRYRIDDTSFSDEDVPKEIYSNPLFDEEIISDKIDASIISSPKINSRLEQFSGELTHSDLIPLGINEADFDPEEDIQKATFLQEDSTRFRFVKPLEDVQNISEELAEYINTPSWNRPAFYFDDDDDQESSIPVRDIISKLPLLTSDFDPEEDIRLVERLLYDNLSPRPPKEFNSENSDAIIDSFSPPPIPVKDNNSLMEEIDLFLRSCCVN